MYFYI
jgi:hypothetical protein